MLLLALPLLQELKPGGTSTKPATLSASTAEACSITIHPSAQQVVRCSGKTKKGAAHPVGMTTPKTEMEPNVKVKCWAHTC